MNKHTQVKTYEQFIQLVEDDKKKDINELTYVKTTREIDLLREAGAVAAKILMELDQHVKPGVTTRMLDAAARAAFYKYRVEIDRSNFTDHMKNLAHHEAICIVRNESVFNALPDDIPLEAGDTIAIDVSLKKDGWCGDTSKMWIVGHECSSLHRRLVAVANEAMWIAIRLIKPGVHTGDLCHAVQTYVESQGFSMTRGTFICSHSIGQVHMDGLYLPLYDALPGTGHVLQAGHVLSIEPHICTGDGQTEIKFVQTEDQTVGVCSLKDKSKRDAYWEHIVAVTDTGYEVLDLRPGEVPGG